MKTETWRKRRNSKVNHGWTRIHTDLGRHGVHQSSMTPFLVPRPLLSVPVCPPSALCAELLRWTGGIRVTPSSSVFIRVHPWLNRLPRWAASFGEMQARFREIVARFAEMDARFPEIRISPNLAKSRQFSAILAKTQGGENFRTPNRLPISSNSVFNPLTEPSTFVPVMTRRRSSPPRPE